jgi:Raf kinase inhibitor-like YbhB/YbcL family protein
MTTTCVCLMAVAAGCNHDGRYLRPATPDQNATISTTAAPSTSSAGDAVGAFDSLAADNIESTTSTTTSTTPSTSTSVAPAETTAGVLADSSTSVLDPTTVKTVNLGGTAATDPGGSTTVAAVDPNAATTVPGQTPSVVAPWRNGAPIDARFTCDGANVSPPLSWSRAPTGTVEVGITVSDEQAPDFVHWAVAGIDPALNMVQDSRVPDGTIQALNGASTPGYFGPCPPQGETHTYQVTVHFLGSQIELGDGALGTDMVLALQASTIASATITGTYARP